MRYDGKYDLHGIKKRYNQIMGLAPQNSDNWQRSIRIKAFWENKVDSSIKHPRLLDVGAGTGVFISRFLQMLPTFSADAVEINPVAIDFLNKYLNIQTFSCLSEIDHGLHFDLITFNRIIEHIRTPITMLQQAKRLLRQNGLIYIELPDALTFKNDGPDSPVFSSAHCMVYSQDSLKYLLIASGLAPLQIEQVRDPSGKWTIYAFAAINDRQ
jgi:ubiquinone/menaquinone biosynthesis C-methylase UbiE